MQVLNFGFGDSLILNLWGGICICIISILYVGTSVPSIKPVQVLGSIHLKKPFSTVPFTRHPIHAYWVLSSIPVSQRTECINWVGAQVRGGRLSMVILVFHTAMLMQADVAAGGILGRLPLLDPFGPHRILLVCIHSIQRELMPWDTLLFTCLQHTLHVYW